MTQDEIYCTLSGLVPTDDDFLDLEDPMAQPIGWTKITIQRAMVNPRWELLQKVKEAQVQQLQEQIQDTQERESLKDVLELQVDNQYAAFEQNLASTILMEQTVYVAPTDNSKELQEALEGVFKTLDIDDELMGEEVVEEVVEKEDSKEEPKSSEKVSDSQDSE